MAGFCEQENSYSGFIKRGEKLLVCEERRRSVGIQLLVWTEIIVVYITYLCKDFFKLKGIFKYKFINLITKNRRSSDVEGHKYSLTKWVTLLNK